MTQSKFENLSAFVDGEQSEQKLVDELCNDAQLSAKWQRYHIARDCLRNELPDELQLDIAANVAKALENEPAIVAPVADKKEESTTKPFFGQVIPMFRQGGQFAVAASVAIAVILGYQQFNQPEVDAPFNAAPTIAVSGIQGGLSPVSLEQTRALPASNVAEQKRKMNAMLIDHQQQVRMKNAESLSEDEKEKSEDKVDDQK